MTINDYLFIAITINIIFLVAIVVIEIVQFNKSKNNHYKDLRNIAKDNNKQYKKLIKLIEDYDRKNQSEDQTTV